MNNLSPHTCSRCREITIDLTKPPGEQEYRYAFDCVATYAKDCAFFQWAHNIPVSSSTSELKITFGDHLSGGLASLRVKWISSLGYTEVGWLYAFVREDDSAAGAIHSRPPTVSRARREDFIRYQASFQDCRGHASCDKLLNRLQQPSQPRRLLYIERGFVPRLRTFYKEPCPRYAALSYCWGPATPQQERSKTLMRNVWDRHKNLDSSDLPLTITDAIKVAQVLELSYLWVDAFCIVQDNDADRETEISKMGSIFQGAEITIAAASSRNSADGFLGERDVEWANGQVFSLPCLYRRGDDETRGSALLSEWQIRDDYTDPIDDRAWTMQEDLLSTRLLRFGSEQTTWRCPSVHRSIDGGSQPFINMGGMDFGRHYKSILPSDTSDGLEYGFSRKWEAWQNSICNYTQRKLSYPQDKLIACAAFAEKFAALHGLNSTEYLAGMWKDDILAQLIWLKRDRLWFNRDPDPETKRWSGPSWSWASLTGPVMYPPREEYSNEQHVVQSRSELDHSKMVYKHQDHSFTKMEPACLWLSGVLQPAHCDGRNLWKDVEFAKSLPLHVKWDSLTYRSQQTMWCFEIMSSPQDDGTYLTLGLILTETSDARFERVGYFQSSDVAIKEWFDKAQKRSICLV